MRQRVLRFLGWVALSFVALCIGLWVAVAIFKPGPKGRIVLATGGAGGAYHALALRYKDELRRYGVELDLRPAIEGADSMRAVTATDGASDVVAGFVKGGAAGSLQGRLASAEEKKLHDGQIDQLRSVGRVFYEPMWVFYTGAVGAAAASQGGIKGLYQFKGRRILIGTAKGGTRLVVMHLLQANGVTPENSTFISEELGEDGAALRENRADVAFVIHPADSKKIQTLVRTPGLLLMNFAAEADAYTNRFPFLTKVVMSQGSIEFAPEIPSADITLLATSAAIVVRRDLHPALVSLLAHAVHHEPKPGFDTEGDPILFHKGGQFPTAEDPEFLLHPDARAIYKAGEPPLFLRGLGPVSARWGLPFWVPAFAHAHGQQSILLLIPLLSILLPLSRLLPALYTWSMRRRLLHWYQQLKQLEAELASDTSAIDLEARRHDLERIEVGVSRIRVPLGFTDQIYDLRLHIDLVRQRLGVPPMPVAAG